MKQATRRYLAAAVTALALAAVPVATVRYPPLLDLPQQLAQIDLLGRALHDPAGPYRVQWWQPDRVGYLLLAVARLAGGAVWGPRLAVLLVQAAWIAGVFALAFRRGRAPEQALLATLFLWSSTFFGGFVHFLLGLGALAFWVPELAADPAERSAGRIALRTFLGGAALWLCHALWLAAALALVPLALALRKARAREWLARAAGLAPWAVLAGLWYPTLARQGWSHEVDFGLPVSARLLSPSFMVANLLGGLRGPVEGWVVVAVAAWIAAGLWGLRADGPRVDRALALLGGVFLGVALLAPQTVGDTVIFGARWGWVAAVCLVLAVPPPRMRASLRTALVVVLVAGFAAVQLAVWRDFERRFTAGFERLLEPIGRGERVLGLNFVRQVPGLQVCPLYHMAAYAQLDRGAELGYSFAETPSSLVVYRDLPAPLPWLFHPEQRSDQISDLDLVHFSWVLAAASPEQDERLVSRFPRLARRAEAGSWKLYAVAAVRPGGEP